MSNRPANLGATRATPYLLHDWEARDADHAGHGAQGRQAGNGGSLKDPVVSWAFAMAGIPGNMETPEWPVFMGWDTGEPAGEA